MRSYNLQLVKSLRAKYKTNVPIGNRAFYTTSNRNYRPSGIVRVTDLGETNPNIHYVTHEGQENLAGIAFPENLSEIDPKTGENLNLKALRAKYKARRITYEGRDFPIGSRVRIRSGREAGTTGFVVGHLSNTGGVEENAKRSGQYSVADTPSGRRKRAYQATDLEFAGEDVGEEENEQEPPKVY